MALSVFDGFTNQDLKAIHTFEKNSRPLTVFWLPGDSSIGVLVSLKGQGNAVFEIDVHSGIARELYRARVVESIFDVSPRTGRLAVSKEYFPLESAPTDHPDLEPALKVDGVDIKWCAYDKGVLYKSRRWRATDLDKWEKGLTIESDSCYVILEGGGITAFEDTDHQYPPFVREIKVHHDGKTEAKWISLTPEEIKALGALAKDRRYIEGEIPNGESGDRK
jgi:hypothetical protein